MAHVESKKTKCSCKRNEKLQKKIFSYAKIFILCILLNTEYFYKMLFHAAKAKHSTKLNPKGTTS